jgi:hypothetical protein
MAVKLQPEYSGNPGNNKYKGIMAKQFYVYILANTRNGTVVYWYYLKFSSVGWVERCFLPIR